MRQHHYGDLAKTPSKADQVPAIPLHVSIIAGAFLIAGSFCIDHCIGWENAVWSLTSPMRHG
jgi:hypothetical protein